VSESCGSRRAVGFDRLNQRHHDLLRRYFYRLLSENGFAVINYPADELAAEAQTSRELAARIKPE
jgi:hypothetical protein